ncbi:hypothetical protein VCRA2130O400_800019 [Vibrio crassostreae]|nr:hypothetical protein VCRA2113O356_150065 [Vibrio crassostreae]CAK2690751.1 hypothetical protein VCRA2133O403_140051 [Vibrio crassostreae]CAK2709095.1 hypothetical protein VCRA2133O401_150065 [Vibrio crassostreae]CAK4024982.1 hypothetical protein VCRA2130O400_800019 [Vibrio crassostreae]CDT14580.1 hypothetical protein VCRLGP8_1350223 [Vibrio crassostreae]
MAEFHIPPTLCCSLRSESQQNGRFNFLGKFNVKLGSDRDLQLYQRMVKHYNKKPLKLVITYNQQLPQNQMRVTSP